MDPYRPDQPSASDGAAPIEPTRYTPPSVLRDRAPVAVVLAVANVAVFVVMAVAGVDVMAPKIDALLRWGANFGPLTLGGEWWRLLTCMFIHIGLVHLFMNVYVLWSAGTVVERLVGSERFVAVYLVSGLMGGIASLGWHPLIVSAGASGALFGIFGALLAYVWRYKEGETADLFRRMGNSVLIFLGFNLIFGLAYEGIDLAAHLGGLAAGFACGLVLGRAAHGEPVARRLGRAAVITAVGLAAVAGAAALLPRGVAGYDRAVAAFGEVETAVIADVNAAIERARTGELSQAELAVVLANDVLPRWRAAVAAFESATDPQLPEPLRSRRGVLLEYMHTRTEGWDLLQQALAEDDSAKVQEAMALQARADELLKKL